MGTIRTEQPGSGVAPFTGNGTIRPNCQAVFSYIEATTSYTWAVTSVPPGSVPNFSASGTVARLSPDMLGPYGIRFTDNLGAVTNVTITVAVPVSIVPDYRAFVAGIQDVGKGQFKWSEDNGAGATTTFKTYQPTEANSCPWVEGTLEVANSLGIRNNHAYTFGWNLNPNGGRVVGGLETSVGWSFEQVFRPTDPEIDFMEAHLVYVTAGDVQMRPMSWAMHRTTNRVGGVLGCDQLVINRKTTAVRGVQFDLTGDLGDGQVVYGDMGHPFYTIYAFNNSPYAYGCKASGATAGLFYIDSSDKLRIDTTGLGARFGGSVGFNDTAPVAKPTITGSRATGAATASLLTALAAMGLITDSSSA